MKLMILDYYTYYGIKKTTMGKGIFRNKIDTIYDIRNRLPDTIRRELLFHSDIRASNCIDVETNKTHIVEYLDKIMDVKHCAYGKWHNIEISEEERPKYAFYFIDVHNAEWGKHVEYEIQRPKCDKETCPWGANILSPIQINYAKLSRKNILRIHAPWLMEVIFVISNDIREKFIGSGITGLKYDRCEIINRKNEGNDVYYSATITKSIIQRAKAIYLHDFCDQHSIIMQGDRCDVRIFQKEISNDDFQVIDRLIVDNKEYRYRIPDFMISRKALEILIEHTETDLQPRGVYFKNAYIPVLFE